MFNWITSNVGGIGLLGAIATFAWPIIQFVLIRRREQRTSEFEVYHRLIKELVSPNSNDGGMWIDRQIAVVFELRNLPRYCEVTDRILTGLQKKWTSDSNFVWSNLLEEIDLTLKYIRRHGS
jgi:hypothetical protein